MSEEILTQEEIMEEPMQEENTEEVVQEEVVLRKNNFCVVAKEADENGWRSIQTSSAWSKNPYGEGFAVVPDDMVPAILETMGFCDIVLNEDGTEVVEFAANEIPDFPEQEPEPTAEERLAAVEEQLLATDEIAVELYENQLAQEEINIAQDEALCELYEMVGV